MITKLFFIAVFLTAILTGCAVTGSIPAKQPSEAERLQSACLDVFNAAEQAVITDGVMDTEVARIPGYPYLRINRFLSSFRDEVNGDSYEFWLKQLQELADQGWRMEIRNLPEPSGQKLQKTIQSALSGQTTTIDSLYYCSDKLLQSQMENRSSRNDLKELATVADNYQTWERIIGIYPLTAWAFKIGIAQWHKKTLDLYKQPLSQLKTVGQLIRYEPPGNELSNSVQIAEILKKSSNNPLKIPLPGGKNQLHLFNSFAPLFEIDVASNDDRIGYPELQKEAAPRINTHRPTVFQHLSHTRLGNRVLLQLNYTIWFPSRPKSSVFDLLGGHLDGITWRVTLLPNGKPWLFDTIHNCGCYHLFFPSQYTGAIDQRISFAESYFVPQRQALVIKQNMRPIVRIAAKTHYIERVYFDQNQSNQVTHYHWDTADSLRSLNLNDGSYRSLFREDGIVAGTERNERYLFWPMGILEPGAMRQSGHHATAFVGRRHFDDAYLFEKFVK